MSNYCHLLRLLVVKVNVDNKSPIWTADNHGTGRDQVHPPLLPVNQGSGHKHLSPFRPSGSRVAEPGKMRRTRSPIIREVDREQMPRSRPVVFMQKRDERRQLPPRENREAEIEQFRLFTTSSTRTR